MNRYIYDRETKESIIETDEMKCCSCEHKFTRDDWAYIGMGDKCLYCKNCLAAGLGSNLFNESGFRPAKVKEVRT